MRTYKILSTFLLISILPSKILAQISISNINQDPKFEQLLNEKRKNNASISANDSYKIQIFNGNNESAKKTLNEFKQENKDIDATIVFNTPNYKVWVGNFKSRMEAEKNLIEIKKKYNSVFLIKPGK